MPRLAVSALLIVFFAVPVAGQSLIGSVSGTVHDEQGGTLPGVSVSLAGKTGEKTAPTDERGYYRFPTLDPGRYDLRAELPGFQAVSRPGLDISIGTQLTVDLNMRVSGREETVEVMGEAPIVDVTSSSTTTGLSQELLFNLPLSRRAQDILNYAPAINDDTAYGGSDGSNALYLDGLDTRSPSTGSQYVYVNYNIIDEVQVGGLGANAEYGGFTGAIVNTVTKSGGNQFSALLDLQWSTGDFGADNVSAETAALNPSLQEPQKTTKLLDATFQLSGPIVKDKLFFLASAQRYELNEKPRGPRTSLDEVTPRLNLKLTYQPSSNDNLSLAFQGEDYNRTGLSNARFIGAAGTTDATSRREDSQDRLVNFQWRHLFGNRTFSEVKYVGWWAYDYLDPEVEAPLRFEGSDGSYSGGGGYRTYFDRRRHQLNASVSHHAEAFGRHDFKFGVELERSRVRDRLSYVGGLYYYDYYGAPYLAYSYGYDQTGDNQRESLYAQDSWSVTDRLTLNAGLRLDNVRGRSPELDETVFDTRSLAPRIGFAWDVTGDRKTVLRGFYGRYYEGVFQTYYYRVLPGLEDLVTYDNSSGVPVEIDRTPLSEIIYRVDPDVKHPRIDEWSVAVERALSGDLRLVASGIFRDNKNFISSVNPSARWERLTVENPLNGQPLPVYGWANPDESERDFLITNPDGFVFLDTDGQPIGTAEASRRYRALMLVLQKRLSDRWQAQVSYVLSKSDGTVDPFSVVNVGYGRQFENPNLALTNADGEHSGSRRHEFKVFATYEIPRIELNVNAYYRFISGYPYTAFSRFSASEIPGLTGAGREPWLEPLGSNRGQDESLLDLRFEKVFKLGAGRDRLAVYADVFNVFNSEWVNDVVIRYPSSSIDGVDVPFGGPASVGTPRQLTLGARWSF